MRRSPSRNEVIAIFVMALFAALFFKINQKMKKVGFIAHFIIYFIVFLVFVVISIRKIHSL